MVRNFLSTRPLKTGTVALTVLVAALLVTMLTACTKEQNYRGVASPHWQELTGEQKQLIVDQAYEQEFGAKTAPTNN